MVSFCSIWIRKKTRDRLHNLKKGKQTLDDVIQGLIEEELKKE